MAKAKKGSVKLVPAGKNHNGSLIIKTGKKYKANPKGGGGGAME